MMLSSAEIFNNFWNSTFVIAFWIKYEYGIQMSTNKPSIDSELLEIPLEVW